MIPSGFQHVLSRALLYQHCRGHDPFLLCTHDGPRVYAVWCPVCERTITAPTELGAVNDWNDHVIARLSAGKGT